MANCGRPIRGAAYRKVFRIKNGSTFVNISGATGLASLLSIDGGAPGAGAAPVDMGSGAGQYYLDITAAQMTGDNVHGTITSTSANAETVDFDIQTERGLASGTAQSGTANTIRLATTAVATNDYYNNATIEIVYGTGAGQRRAIKDYTGSNRDATVDYDWIVNPDSSSVYVVHARADGQFPGGNAIQDVNVVEIAGDDGAATLLGQVYHGGAIAGQVSDVTPTTTEFDAATGLSATDDFYADTKSMILFTSGTLAGLANLITGYVGATRTFSFETPWPTAPANGDLFVIIGHVET
jgi:hypothetical protein